MSQEKKTITELTDILDQDIESIVALRLHAERKVSRHQRLIEKVTQLLGRPLSVYIILLIIALWILLNIFHSALDIQAIDFPPFPLLQGAISLSALLMTIIILTTQNRQEKLTEQRRHLDLQITLLTERKVSKLIELFEKLYLELPTVDGHIDTEAGVMKEPIDPHAALMALNQTLKEAAKELEFDFE